MPNISFHLKPRQIAKKSVSAALLFAILSSTLFPSCSDNAIDNASEADTSTSQDNPASEAVADETQADVMAYLGKKDFNGSDFIVIGRGPGSGEWESFEIAAEALNGSMINDAVYGRNLYINEAYNVNLVAHNSDTSISDFQNAIAAATNDYQAALIAVNESITMAVEGKLYDFRELPTVDLESRWYDQNANKSLSVANRLYFSFGDMNLQNLDLTWCVMFNKQLAEEHQLGNMYELVKNNEWTIDKLIELTSGISKDADGNGEMNQYDYYGMATPFGRTALAMLYSSGVEFVTKNADDYPEYISISENTYTVFSKVLRYFHDGDTVLNIDGKWREAEKMFMNNQILFYIECMQNLSRFRDMEVDFGVIPMPKYAASQDNYISMVCNFPAALVIPSYCFDTDFTGFMVEAINAKSSETVRTAYVDKCLMYKYSRDEESSGMLEIILDTMYYDPAFIYGWGGLTTTIELLVTKNYDMLSSQSKSIEPKIRKDIEKCIEKYQKNQ